MGYILAVIVVLLFALFFFIAGFLLKDARKHTLVKQTEIQTLRDDLETCRKETLK